MTAHSPLGPSSAERWINCPGSVRLTEGLPDTGSEYAAEGTAAHTLTEICRMDGKSARPWLGKTIPQGAFNIEVTEEMVDAVDMFVEYVEETPGDRLMEHRVAYDRWVPKGFGTLDDARLQPRRAHVTDFKYGKGIQVYVKENVQMMCYALGVLEEFDWAYDFEDFVLTIHQPRLDHIDTWTIGREDLLAWAESVLRPAAQQACKDNAPLRAGSWCMFCKVKATCAVRAGAVFETVVGEFEDLEEAASKTFAPRQLLNNDEIAAVLNALPNISKWCKDVEAHAMLELQQGRPVGDFKLVEGRSSRGWGLPEADMVKVWAEQGLKEDDLYVKKLMTMPAAEKLIGKKHPLWTTERVVSKPPGKPTMVPGADPRPPMVLDGSLEFNNLDEGDE